MTIEKNRRFTYLALLSAVAIALNLLESIYIGPIFGVLRLGLANIAALLALKIMGRKEMIIVNVMRVVIGNLLRGTIFSSTFWISSGGVILSSLVMLGMDKLDSSLLFTSIIGSVAHSSGQVLIVSDTPVDLAAGNDYTVTMTLAAGKEPVSARMVLQFPGSKRRAQSVPVKLAAGTQGTAKFRFTANADEKLIKIHLYLDSTGSVQVKKIDLSKKNLPR
jgi:heptaprenyl diphosphate synthase